VYPNRYSTVVACTFYGTTAPSWPEPRHCPGFTVTLRHTIRGRTPVARRRDLYLTKHNTYKRQTDIHAPSGIRTHNTSKRVVAEWRLGPHGCWCPVL